MATNLAEEEEWAVSRPPNTDHEDHVYSEIGPMTIRQASCDEAIAEPTSPVHPALSTPPQRQPQVVQHMTCVRKVMWYLKVVKQKLCTLQTYA